MYIADLKLLLANIETLPVKSENSGLDLIVNSSTYVILGLLCNQMAWVEHLSCTRSGALF